MKTVAISSWRAPAGDREQTEVAKRV